jgi:tocopherol O-methyltransferase
MITPRTPFAPPAVARHYDALDRFYRELWGEHVHHGLWTTGEETPEEAALALSRLVCERAAVRPGDRVCDVGCGYGATSRLFAHDCGAEVTALTVSRGQHQYAVSVDPNAHNPLYLLRDWLANRLPSASFDAVVAIESTEHMVHRGHCMHEMGRILKPGGRAVVCAWIAREGAGATAERLLLEPICREGRLAGMGTEAEYRAMLERAGLVVERVEELSDQVRRTWSICLGRLALGILREPSYRRFLRDSTAADRVFALTMVRIWVAYVTGAMRYCVFTARKPAAA